MDHGDHRQHFEQFVVVDRAVQSRVVRCRVPVETDQTLHEIREPCLLVLLGLCPQRVDRQQRDA